MTFSEQPGKPGDILIAICGMRRHDQRDLGSSRLSAGDIQSAADPLGSFMHSQKAEMILPAALQDVRRNP
jgi:hypothetical protein